jgi:hypothetical protein
LAKAFLRRERERRRRHSNLSGRDPSLFGGWPRLNVGGTFKIGRSNGGV